jgi:hypothetical protein
MSATGRRLEARMRMKILTCLLALTAVASADPAKPSKTDVLHWETFPGPAVAPAVTTGEAFVVSPIQSSTWKSGLSFVLAPIVEAKPQALIVQGPFSRFEVPGVFVGPVLQPAKVARGAYVLFQENATMTLTLHVARVTAVGKDSYTVAYEFGGSPDTADVAANHVLPLDGKAAFGQPVSFQIDGKAALAWYVAPGRETGTSWVLSVGHPFEETDPKPLKISAFKKGAKVLAVFGTTSVLKLVDGKQPPARQYLEKGTVVDVLSGGVTYKVRADEGDDKGETHELAVDEVFAR